MVSPQCSDLNDDCHLSIPETTPEPSGKCFITAPQNTGCPTSGGFVSAASSLDKKPIPEEAGSVPIQEEKGNVTSLVKSPAPEEAGPELSHPLLVKCPAPEEEESVPCFLKRPVPEQSLFISLVSFKLKSPAPEEQSAVNVKNHLKDELDQNPLKEGPKGTNHRTDKENVQENIANPMDVTSDSPGAQLAVTDGCVKQIPPRGFNTVRALLPTRQILDPSSFSWALKKMKQNGFDLLLMAVIFLSLCDNSGAVECFVGWVRGTDLSNQTLVVRNNVFSCIFDSPSTFPLIHTCFPLIMRMENKSFLQLESENMSEYLVEYNDGNLGRSKTVQVTIRRPDCSGILDPPRPVNKSDRNHIVAITAGIVTVAVVAVIILTIRKYKKRRSQSGDPLV